VNGAEVGLDQYREVLPLVVEAKSVMGFLGSLRNTHFSVIDRESQK
jgi:hypothetical protein